MGTGRCGLYDSLDGGPDTMSTYAVVHSSEGTFTYNPRNKKISKLKSGGHGQRAIELMDRHGVKYTIVSTYENEVRIGYVEDHKNKAKQSGTNQSWFPKSWSETDIRNAGNYVARLKQNANLPDGKIGYGTYKGVRVGIIKTNGQPMTVFPDSDQSSVSVIKTKKEK